MLFIRSGLVLECLFLICVSALNESEMIRKFCLFIVFVECIAVSIASSSAVCCLYGLGSGS